ncbi:hypothetical protein Tco_1260369 [Tanacetum coccineum]
MTPTLPKSQGPKVPEALSKKSKRTKSKRPPIMTKVTPPKPKESFEQSHLVSSGTVPDPQDLERDIQLASTGLPSTLDEGTRTGAKYQVDQTQSTRLRYQSLPENEGKPSHEGELDTQPIILSTYADVKAFLLSDDESKEDIIGSGEEINDEPQAAGISETHHQSLPPQADKPQSSHTPSTKALDTDSSSDDILMKYDNTLPLTERQLAHALKQDEKLVAWAKSSTNMAWNLGSRLLGLERAQNHLQSSIVTPTLALTHIPANVEGENTTNTATEDPPSHTEEETGEPKRAIPISIIQPITIIITHLESS